MCVCVVYMCTCVFEEGAGTQPWIARSYFCNGHGDLESTPVSSRQTFTFFVSSHFKPLEILCSAGVLLPFAVVSFYAGVITGDFYISAESYSGSFIRFFSTSLHTHEDKDIFNLTNTRYSRCPTLRFNPKLLKF